jgi:sec-independent protein translocase protein TatB
MNLGFGEMLFILVLALLIFGPRKLPDIGRQIGRALGEFRRASTDFRMQLDEEVRRIEAREDAKKTGDLAQLESENAETYQPVTLKTEAPTGTVASAPMAPDYSPTGELPFFQAEAAQPAEEGAAGEEPAKPDPAADRNV